jgi:uncharacterized protein (DUF433 family)
MPDDRRIIDQEIAHGKPIIKGIRVLVEIILGSLAGGMDIKEVADEYCLDREDILAAIDQVIDHTLAKNAIYSAEIADHQLIECLEFSQD